jgi:hypothetical protein
MASRRPTRRLLVGAWTGILMLMAERVIGAEGMVSGISSCMTPACLGAS